MFQVQRFTAESDSDHDGTVDGKPAAGAGVTQRDVLLSRLLEKANARAKRARGGGVSGASDHNADTGAEVIDGKHKAKAARYEICTGTTVRYSSADVGLVTSRQYL